MSKQFTLKPIFSEQTLTTLVQKYGLKRMTDTEIGTKLNAIFEEYILLALSEMGGTTEERNAAYNEAIWYLGKAQKLLLGQPHPASKMAQKLKEMSVTLSNVIQGGDNQGAERAKRFVEKNLVRKLKQLWEANTSAPFLHELYFDGHSAIEFLLDCFELASNSYPEIEWFKAVTPETASKMIRSIK